VSGAHSAAELAEVRERLDAVETNLRTLYAYFEAVSRLIAVPGPRDFAEPGTLRLVPGGRG
jgi:hypothetical protein